MSHWTTTGTLVLGCVVVLYLGRRALGSRTAFPLPPGPPGLPWVGTVIGVNTNAPWLTYAEWGKTYGRVQHCQWFVVYLSLYPYRQPGPFSTVWERYHHHQFGKGCEGPSREPVQELFGPPIPYYQ